MTATAPALALHVGRVGHVRHSAPRTRFSYRMWMISVDLDALATSTSRLFRHNRAGLVSLHDRDHGPRDGSPLRPWVEARGLQAGLGAYGASHRFMVLPRILGYAFNPIAFFFCHDADGRLGAILHQVKNTFGDQTSYLLPAASDGTARGTTAKRMHVSPLFDMDGGYRFAVSAPDFADPNGQFAIAIHYGAASTPRLTATMRLAQRRFSTAAVARLLLAMPLLPVTVMAAIHWEALKLWVRGARFHAAPPHLPAGDLGGVA
jgi:DUF1365 family protein